VTKTAISPYIEYKKTDDIHGTVLYPAVMIAPMQRDVLRAYIDDNSNKTILDPFCGSGTALYEAAETSSRVKLYGSDINPLAILISRVKLQGVSNSIERDLDAIRERLVTYSNNVEVHSFNKIEKWFQPDIIKSLSSIRASIMLVSNRRNRLFFWYMLVDIIRKYCNSRSSTYKLHMRAQGQIDRIENNVINDYLEKASTEYVFFRHDYSSRIDLNQGDSIAYLKGCAENSFDICITSPPYGENRTTVPYGQYSLLALKWIDEKDLSLEGWELEGCSAIDSRSLGGPRHTFSLIDTMLEKEISETIRTIRVDKQLKVKRFLSGYFSFLNEIARVTKETLVFTLGNRTVDGKCINLTSITKEYLKNKGFLVATESARVIPFKRTPANVSQVNGSAVSSMNEEFLLIMEKSDALPTLLLK
jgi:site-specific DNA-methyltransferase (cytosine-N4-specific)